MPPEASAILAGLVRHAELRHLLDLATTRQRTVLHDRSGNKVGELDDDTVTVTGGPNDGLRFRQLELELAEGERGSDQSEVTGAVVGALAAAGARAGDGAKFAKALGVGAAADGRRGRPLTKRARMSDVVRASIEDGLGRLLAHDYLLRAAGSEPGVEDVHQARVASRRLRSDLKTLRPVLDPVWNDHMRDDLRWLGNLLGEVRDVDVLRQEFGSSGDGGDWGDGLRQLDAALSAQRRAAWLRCGTHSGASAISACSIVSTPPRCRRPCSSSRHGTGTRPCVPGQRAHKALPSVVDVPWRSLRKRVRKAGRKPSDVQLHRIRIGAKQLRYASELASPVMGEPARRTARRAEALQTVLGEHHDAVFAEAWLRRESTGLAGPAVLEAGRLIEVQRRRQAELRREWRGRWRSLAKKKDRRWLKA